MIDWSQHTNLEVTDPLPHHSLYTALTQSTNKYEQASGWLNLTLEYYTQNHKIDTIIHHYYTADTQFP
jgi:1,4-alpha-glucan branching enzyme